MSNYKKLMPQEAKELMEKEQKFIILDVRTPEEYLEGHLKGALNIPLYHEEIEEKVEDKDIPIYIYCHSGVRSARAASILLDMEYNKVYDIGGIIHWPYEVLK